MTAHPKMDPETGEMLFFGYAPVPAVPHVPRRRPRRRPHPLGGDRRRVAVDDARLRDHQGLRDLHAVPGRVRLRRTSRQSGSLFSWQPERGAKLGVMPRSGGNADVRWFDIDPCYVFHPMNAYAENGVITLDVARYEQLLFMDPNAARDPGWRDKNVARLHRFTIDLAQGHGRLDAARRRRRRVPARRRAPARPEAPLRLHGAHRTGGQRVRHPGVDRRSGSTTSSAARTETRQLRRRQRRRRAALRAAARRGRRGRRLRARAQLRPGARTRAPSSCSTPATSTGEPLAEIRVPHRVPYGFHGNWVPGGVSSSREAISPSAPRHWVPSVRGRGACERAAPIARPSRAAAAAAAPSAAPLGRQHVPAALLQLDDPRVAQLAQPVVQHRRRHGVAALLQRTERQRPVAQLPQHAQRPAPPEPVEHLHDRPAGA